MSGHYDLSNGMMGLSVCRAFTWPFEDYPFLIVDIDLYSKFTNVKRLFIKAMMGTFIHRIKCDNVLLTLSLENQKTYVLFESFGIEQTLSARKTLSQMSRIFPFVWNPQQGILDLCG